MFGEEFHGREIVNDPMNRDLFVRMLRSYNFWHLRHHHFHPEFSKDLQWISRLEICQYLGAFAGIMFAGTVWNPNYVKRRSWYMRKFAIVAWGSIGWMFFKRYHDDQVTNTMLKMYDYYPLEVKRALRDKDFRHLALFDPANPGR